VSRFRFDLPNALRQDRRPAKDVSAEQRIQGGETEPAEGDEGPHEHRPDPGRPGQDSEASARSPKATNAVRITAAGTFRCCIIRWSPSGPVAPPRRSDPAGGASWY